METILHCTTKTDGIGYYYLMEKNGYGFIRGAIYLKDELNHKSMTMDSLSVDTKFQKKGYGLSLLESMEKIGTNQGCTFIFLYVDEASWMHYWYERIGYEYYSQHDEMPGMVWLVKNINQ